MNLRNATSHSYVSKNPFVVAMFVMAIASLLLFASPVRAQDSLQLEVEPEKLTIAGTNKDKIKRTLVLTSNKPISGDRLQISFRDLYRASDEKTVFSSTAQTAKLIADRDSELEYKIPLEFDLSQSTSRGEFFGNVVLRYQQDAAGNTQTIIFPITVKIRNNWFFPLLTIVLGTLLGMGLSWYRSKGRPRDEILVRVGRLRTWMEKDPQFDRSRGFKSQVEYHLSNVRSAIQEERWSDAESYLSTAKTIWQKWHQGKTLLIPQLEYARDLEQTVADLNPQQPFKNQILYQITEQVEQAPDLDSTEQLRTNLNEIAAKINAYNQLKIQLKQVNQLGSELARVYPQGAKVWQPRLQDWQQQFDSLTIEDDLDKLLAELKNAAIKIDEAIPKGRGVAAKNITVVADERVIDNAPTGMALALSRGFQKANLNLKIFAWTSYFVALILLIGAGFNEMYLKNETFGERPFGDYFALLAWGFGAEASREAIASAIEGWGLAGLDKN